MKHRVLIVDDEPDIRELLAITLDRMNLDSKAASNLAEARQLLDTDSFSLCLTDMKLPDGDGIDLVREIQEENSNLPVAVITAHGSTETALESLKAGAFDFVSKPVDLIKLRTLVNTALKLTLVSEQPSDAQALAGLQIIGQSPLIIKLKERIHKVARSQAPVFIGGESGSGKELIARAIHEYGPRKDQPFIAVNCGAIPSELMESELFGHLKGSFTGAHSNKNGLFQAADGGTLFLDEIADLPLSMQVKLLRAIQEKAVRPVGSQAEVHVDVRILSASHKNLTKEVARSNLRQDLYYRINVIELRAPSLRERIEDIPLLTDYILKNLATEDKSAPLEIDSQALDQLSEYAFPGNVRELENILQRASALTDDGIIHQVELPDKPELITEIFSDAERRHAAEEPATTTIKAPSPEADTKNVETGLDIEEEQSEFSLEKHLEAIEIKAIKKALEDCRWNKTKAAKQLGMSFRSFRYRVKKLGLDDS